MRTALRKTLVCIALLASTGSPGCSGGSESQEPRAMAMGAEKFNAAGADARDPMHSSVAGSGPIAASSPHADRVAPFDRAQIDGRAFPDKVLALTWDDGPDVNTLALADYLKARKISATFFVVREWVGSFSSDPGTGSGVQSTGYDAIPILGDLVQLGHRLGNHTLNHVLFSGESAQAIDAQIRENQARLDPFATNELRIFRAPGGAWDEAGARAVGGDRALRGLVGPVRWDVDRKDWENSLACRSDHPHTECEHEGPERRARVKPSVTARRYLESIEEAGHGIVLLHDRVGDVGSRYALDVAQSLVPELVARGYVFAAPVLAFSPLTSRFRIDGSTRAERGTAPIHLADLDGDGRADLCAADAHGVACAQSTTIAPAEKGGLPTTAFRATLPMGRRIGASGWGAAESGAADRFILADVDGDGAADACGRTNDGIACLVSTVHRDRRGARAKDEPATWATCDASDFAGALETGDLDGDGRADICGRSAIGLVCARSLGARFETARVWHPLDTDRADRADRVMRLGDVDGDGRADLCVAGDDGVACALSNGASFGPLTRWSPAEDLGPTADLREVAIALGDLNGDGRADLCARRRDGVSCALSRGHAFTRSTLWLAASREDAAAWLPFESHADVELVDINGDGRADICGEGDDGIACALAP